MNYEGTWKAGQEHSLVLGTASNGGISRHNALENLTVKNYDNSLVFFVCDLDFPSVREEANENKTTLNLTFNF